MKRAIQLAVLGMLATAGGAWAQVQSTVKVGLSLEGVYFYVDGRLYNSTQIFLWPEGSKHTIQFLLSVDLVSGDAFPYQAGNFGTVRYTLNNWITNGPVLATANSPVLTVTASSTVTSVIGQVSALYKLHFLFYSPSLANPNSNCQNAPGDAPQDGIRNGIIYLDNQCIGDTTDVFVTAGLHTLNAFPYPGFVFAGWFMNNNGATDKSYLTSINVTTNQQIIPEFQPAKRVRFSTNPVGLKLIIDRTPIQTYTSAPQNKLPSGNVDSYCTPDFSRLPVGAPPGLNPLCVGDFDFLPGSTHLVGVELAQQDNIGHWWVFTGFSNGMKNNSNYTVDLNVGQQASVVANFAPGFPATLLTLPGGLKMQVDGTDKYLSYNFIWAAQDQHTVSAPSTQIDSHGRKYNFIGWSNGGTQTQTVSVPADPAGLTLMAKYERLGQVVLSSAPVGLTVNVDGKDCTTPCTFDRSSGTQMQVSAPKSTPSTQVARLDFDSWNGQPSNALAVTFTTDVQSLLASYHNSFLVMASSDPPGQVTFKFAPPSPDGYYAEGTAVTVTAVANGGYKFRRWDGDLAGTYSTGYLSIDGPHTIVARLDKVPYIPPAGVKNAAGDTPDGTVAPGSIISIYGENLAAALMVGSGNPLVQTLGDVTVTVNDHLLPLLFVSPKQINAQAPSGLADGVYPIRVTAPGQPDVTGSFTIKRNSPGLFTVPNDKNAPLVLALHEDGSAITLDSPARRNETVSIFGTGFGPYSRPAVDGFIVPDPSLYKLIDPVTVLAGDLTLTPEWTGAASVAVGATEMKLKVTDAMPHGTTVDLTVSVNGVLSNKVQLPVE